MTHPQYIRASYCPQPESRLYANPLTTGRGTLFGRGLTAVAEEPERKPCLGNPT